MKAILTYELKQWLKDWKFYIYLSFFVFGTFVIFAGTAGFFDSQPNNVKEPVFLNAPYEVIKIWNFLFKAILFFIPAIVGISAYKDFKSKTHSVVFSYPITKKDYVLGKFVSGLVPVLLIVFATSFTMMLVEQLPNLHSDKIGDFNLAGHLQSLFVYILPNVLFISLIVFSIVLYFRNIYLGFAIIIILFLLRNILPNAIEDTQLLAIIDPFAEFTFIENTADWNKADKNIKSIPFNSLVLANRILWLVISLGIFLFTFKRFQLHENRDYSNKRKTPKNDTKKPSKKNIKYMSDDVYEASKKENSSNYSAKAIVNLTRFNFNYIIRSWMFYVILVLGLLSVFFAVIQVTNGQKITILPVTNVVLSIPAFFFTSIITLLTFMYAGMLVNRDKAVNMNLMVDSTPVSNTTLLLSKFMAIVSMQIVLLLVMMVVGIGIQMYNGYYNFEIGQYLFNLFFVQLTGLLIWAVTSIFIHTLVRNTFFGIFILIIIWLASSALPEVGINTKLALFNFFEPLPFSDMFGYGNALSGFTIGKLYWISISVLLFILSLMLVVRGQAKPVKERLMILKQRFSRPIKTISTTALMAIFLTGFVIYDNEHKNDRLSLTEQNKAFNAFEDSFKTYAKIDNQPKVIAMRLNIDLFPKTNKFTIKGSYEVVNKSNKPIDTLLIKTGFDESSGFTLNKPYDVIDRDDYVKFYVLKFKESLKPGEKFQFQFESISRDPSIFDRNLEVVKNGSYIKNDLLPRFGYFLNKQNKLPSDANTLAYNYYSRDSDVLDIETVLSTDSGQKAFAVGELIDTWKADNRVFFKYKTAKPLKNSLSFISGTYKEEKNVHKGVAFSVNAIENHHKNSESMLSGLKASYDYNTRFFTPYQHKDAKIIEFPKTFGTYATVTGNLIPTSEIRFIASAPEGKVDLSFYAIAHEFTHYWWGNQLMPADALGAMMLTESVTEYLSLNIYEETFGKERARAFLKLQRERYLKGRNRDSDKETTLEYVDSEKQYISYAKGAMVFNGLRHHWGENNLNAFLKDFLLENKSENGIYPTSYQFINELSAEVPEDLRYLIQDGFRDIVLYDLSFSKVNTKEIKDNLFEVSVEIAAVKNSYKTDEKQITMNDLVQVGFYDSNDKLMALETIKVNSNQFETTFQLHKKPSKIVIDPEILLIEKDTSDNTYRL